VKMLFVCTGNICRSPTAERLAAAHASRRGIGGLSVSSAGTQAVVGRPIHPEAAQVIERLGGCAGGFTARRLTARMTADADLIITMTTAHRDAVVELAPQQLHRTFSLSEAALLVSEHGARNLKDLSALRSRLASAAVTDIVDPIGQSRAVFTTVGAHLARLLPAVLTLCRD
jgi:protein-tyrosine phosphatase